jgi:hypothetical protein
MGSSNIGQTDMAKSRKMREQMEDTFWFRAPSGQGKTWGKSYVRILPAHTNMDGVFYWGVPIHFRIGPGQQILPCPRKAFNQPCPICQAGFTKRTEGKEEEFRSLMPSWQAYMNVVVLNEDGTPAEDPPRVRVWTLSRKWLDQILDEADEVEGFTDLDTGRDVAIRRRGEEFSTEYRIKLASEPSKFDNPVAEELRDLQTISPYVDQATLALALEAPAGGGDPWAGEQLPAGGAREPDQITQGSGSRFGPDEPEEPTEEPQATGEAPSEDQQSVARERLQRAAAQKPADDK